MLKQLRSEGIEGYFAIKYAQFAKDTPVMRKLMSPRPTTYFIPWWVGKSPLVKPLSKPTPRASETSIFTTKLGEGVE